VPDRDRNAEQLNVLTATARYQADPHTVLDIVLASPDRDNAAQLLMRTFVHRPCGGGRNPQRATVPAHRQGASATPRA
jgi:hypothetical protein